MIVAKGIGKSLLISLAVYVAYAEVGTSLVHAGVPAILVLLTAMAGTAAFAHQYATSRWQSSRPGAWALLGLVFGVYALPVVLLQGERARTLAPSATRVSNRSAATVSAA
jgi:uncharacterized protein YqgC (DUF456 family)